MKCSLCGSVDNVAYIVVGNQSICIKCKDKKGEKVMERSKDSTPQTRFFTQYICKTHNCGTTNVNQISRHEMPECDIYEKVIPHWHKPKTFGGHGGDINRRYYVSSYDVRMKLIGRWNRYIKPFKMRMNAKKGYRYKDRR